jgi:hypothetical protein
MENERKDLIVKGGLSPVDASREGLQRDGGLLHHLGLQNMSAFVVAYLSASGHCGTGLRVLHT